MVDKAKKMAEELMEKAQSLLCKDGFVAPVIFAVQGDRTTPVLLRLENQDDKDVIPTVLKNISKGADYLIMIMDSIVKPLGENEEPPDNIKDHPDSCESISVFLYLKDQSFVRHVTYVKADNGYNFFDQGWEEVRSTSRPCRFSNPFQS